MNTENKKFWKNFFNLTVSKVIVTVWNGIALCYHWFVIGFDFKTSIILQLTAWIMEYLLCDWYENMLIKQNQKIDEKTKFIRWPWRAIKRFLIKYVVFLGVFTLVYLTTYYIRLKFFYAIDFGVNDQKFIESMRNMLVFTPIAGPIMGIMVIIRKKRLRQKADENRYARKIKNGYYF